MSGSNGSSIRKFSPSTMPHVDGRTSPIFKRTTLDNSAISSTEGHLICASGIVGSSSYNMSSPMFKATLKTVGVRPLANWRSFPGAHEFNHISVTARQYLAFVDLGRPLRSCFCGACNDDVIGRIICFHTGLNARRRKSNAAQFNDKISMYAISFRDKSKWRKPLTCGSCKAQRGRKWRSLMLNTTNKCERFAIRRSLFSSLNSKIKVKIFEGFIFANKKRLHSIKLN